MRILNLADGYSSATEPIVTPVQASGLAQYISDSAYVTANGGPTGGNAYHNTTINLPRYYTGTEWITLGESVVVIQEYIGTGNGVQTVFAISNAPINDEALQVFLNGKLAEKSEYAIALPNITFGIAPTVGQRVYVSYLSNGAPATPIVSVGTQNVIYIAVDASDISAKETVLPSLPAEPTKVMVWYYTLGGGILQYSVDYIVTGNILSWDTLGLEAYIADGDILAIQYFN